jgi:hypothetical protein
MKLFAEVSELFTHAVFQLVAIHKKASLDCIHEWAEKIMSEGVKSSI